ncbi:hypothetical protein [Salinicola sp. MIT1003]|uniref:hypothetical protein n=1 Tax=Salinicola sp. MIT1003 TaxID=1882734 RepID=UPI0008DC712F|nr:hypothetical protein [Salinicola sp. MIT1003]OHZ02988.1 hypothetical protein BC443_14965 [Salinicola sp. MIT1003]
MLITTNNNPVAFVRTTDEILKAGASRKAKLDIFSLMQGEPVFLETSLTDDGQLYDLAVFDSAGKPVLATGISPTHVFEGDTATGEDYASLAAYPSLCQAWDRLARVLAGRTVVSYQASETFYRLLFALSDCGIEFEFAGLVDASEALQRVLGSRHSLASAYELLGGQEAIGSDMAYGKALMLAQVYRSIADSVEEPLRSGTVSGAVYREIHNARNEKGSL